MRGIACRCCLLFRLLKDMANTRFASCVRTTIALRALLIHDRPEDHMMDNYHIYPLALAGSCERQGQLKHPKQPALRAS